VNELYRRTALATGLVIDQVWPRIALVASDEVLRQVRRGERGVLVWRITVAAALGTAGTWLLIALTGFGGFRYTDWRPVPLVWGPLLVAAIALVQARRLLAEVNQAKADAVEVYRYDLAKRMHITLPPDPSGPYMTSPRTDPGGTGRRSRSFPTVPGSTNSPTSWRYGCGAAYAPRYARRSGRGTPHSTRGSRSAPSAQTST
jgi:hypothetical protein